VAEIIVGFIVRIIISLILAGITVAIANGPLHHSWNYFVVFVCWVVICYGGWWLVDLAVDFLGDS